METGTKRTVPRVSTSKGKRKKKQQNIHSPISGQRTRRETSDLSSVLETISQDPGEVAKVVQPCTI